MNGGPLDFGALPDVHQDVVIRNIRRFEMQSCEAVGRMSYLMGNALSECPWTFKDGVHFVSSWREGWKAECEAMDKLLGEPRRVVRLVGGADRG